MRQFLTCIAALAIFASCNQEGPKTDTAPEQTDLTPRTEALDTNVMVSEIDNIRESIEREIEGVEPVEISTDSLRAKIKQKWSKIHYYVKNNQVMRIKTYPHEAVSSRTEEFYFDNELIRLAVIEDEGSAETENISKMYYYANDVPVKELNPSGEKEYSIRNSEGEELMQEAYEYLDIYKEMN